MKSASSRKQKFYVCYCECQLRPLPTILRLMTEEPTINVISYVLDHLHGIVLFGKYKTSNFVEL